MKTIFLHIGLGKTGTTAIQSFLANNQDFLSTHGIKYIQAGGGSTGIGHQSFAKSFIDKFPFYMIPPDKPNEQQKIIAKEIQEIEDGNILLSSENFQLANPKKVHDFLKKNKWRFIF